MYSKKWQLVNSFFFGGKNLYLFSKSSEIDLIALMLSGAIYIALHGIIHLMLSELEGK